MSYVRYSAREKPQQLLGVATGRLTHPMLSNTTTTTLTNLTDTCTECALLYRVLFRHTLFYRLLPFSPSQTFGKKSLNFFEISRKSDLTAPQARKTFGVSGSWL